MKNQSLKTIYLAGPDVFYPNAIEIGEAKKAICQKYGLIGLHPVDNNLEEGLGKREMALRIYKGNIEFMHQADAIVANITPFRGSGMDPGTAFEIGFFVAMNKPVFLYSNDNRDYAARVERQNPLSYFDNDNYLIEDFGMNENLMIALASEATETGLQKKKDDCLENFEKLLASIVCPF